MPASVRRKLGVSTTTLGIIVTVLMVGILLTLINVYELRRLQTDHFMSSHGLVPEASTNSLHQKICWVEGHGVSTVIFYNISIWLYIYNSRIISYDRNRIFTGLHRAFALPIHFNFPSENLWG